MTNEIQVVNGNTPALAREYGVEYLRERYQMLVQAAKQVLRDGVDYGVIPGTEKPTLLKPGAEKLATLFGLRPHFELLDKIEDWDNGFFYYRYRCTLVNRYGESVGNAEGSANTKEKRYRWRYIPVWKATENDKARAVRIEERKDKHGRKYKVYVLENDDPYTLVNTVQKVALKRALVAAVLVTTGASEFFTQDLEDVADDTHAPEAPEPAPAPPQPPRKATRQQKPPKGGNGGDGPTAFWTKAREWGIEHGVCMEIINKCSEEDKGTDWALALETLGAVAKAQAKQQGAANDG